MTLPLLSPCLINYLPFTEARVKARPLLCPVHMWNSPALCQKLIKNLPKKGFSLHLSSRKGVASVFSASLGVTRPSLGKSLIDSCVSLPASFNLLMFELCLGKERKSQVKAGSRSFPSDLRRKPSLTLGKPHTSQGSSGCCSQPSNRGCQLRARAAIYGR